MSMYRGFPAAALAGLLIATALPAEAVVALAETPTIGANGDADDPAIWLHPTDLAKSLVITALGRRRPGL